MDPFIFKYILSNSDSSDVSADHSEPFNYEFAFTDTNYDKKLISNESQINNDSRGVKQNFEYLLDAGEDAIVLKRQTSKEDGLFEESTSSFIQKDLIKNEWITSPNEGLISLQNHFNKQEDLSDQKIGSLLRLEDKYLKVKRRQELIEHDQIYIKGPGRKRRNPYQKAKQIKNMATRLLIDKFNNILNTRVKRRKDALFTLYFRTLKRLIIELTNNWATKNEYKSSEIGKFSNSFIDSHYAFLIITDNVAEGNLYPRLAEFIAITYPEDKVSMTFDVMEKEGYWTSKHLLNQKKILSQRDNTSKLNVENWISQSETLRALLKFGLDVLQLPRYTINSYAKSLRLTTQKLLENHHKFS